MIGENTEYEYEWNNFVIVQTINLDNNDKPEEEAINTKTAKQEVHYSNLLSELGTLKESNQIQQPPVKIPPTDIQNNGGTKNSQIENSARTSHLTETNKNNSNLNRVSSKEEIIYYKCHLCFQHIPANEFNEHYKAELKAKQKEEEAFEQNIQEETLPEIKPEEDTAAKQVDDKFQNIILKRERKKNQDDIEFKKKEMPDFLK